MLKNCSKWQNFDSDLYSGGATILWNLAHTSKQQHTSPSFLQLGTEGRKPKALTDRKIYPSKWKKNVKKLWLNQGFRKYGSSVDTDIIPPLQNVKLACENCRKNCQVKFTEEERLDLNENFWKLENITAKRLLMINYVTLTPKQRNRKRDSMKTGKRREKDKVRDYKFLHPNNGN